MNTGHKPHGAGNSSFGLVDTGLVLKMLGLTPSTVFLDLGCGKGDYSVAAAKRVVPDGIVYAVDAWQEGLDELSRRALSENLNNIIPIQADVQKHIPLGDAMIDVCLMANVLHDLLRETSGETPMREVVRVLKPYGRLCVVEFKKGIDGPGPPADVRLAPEEVDLIVRSVGLVKDQLIDAGPYHYLFTAFHQESELHRLPEGNMTKRR